MNEQKHAFLEYLTEKKLAQNTIDEHMRLFDLFSDTPPIPAAIGEFVGIFVKHHGYDLDGARKKYRFLEIYADFCESQINNDEMDDVLPLMSDAIRSHIRNHFEDIARRDIAVHKKRITLIPKDTKIAPYYLGTLSNDEFVSAFGSLQQFVYDIYEAIEQGSPFEWGFPGWKGVDCYGDYISHVLWILIELVYAGTLDGNTLVVDKKKCRPGAFIAKLTTMGVKIEGHTNKKDSEFTLSHPNNPHIFYVLCAFFKDRTCRDCRENCPKHHVSFKNWNECFYQRLPFLLSHRFVEEPAAQAHDLAFLSHTDNAPEDVRKLQHYIYDEAIKHGFSIDPFEARHRDGIVYRKGSKKWLLMKNDSDLVTIRFKKIFEKYPEKKAELDARFPGIFKWKWNFVSHVTPIATSG